MTQDQTRLDHYLRTDTSFGKGGFIGELLQHPASASIAGVAVEAEFVKNPRGGDFWLVTYVDGDGDVYKGLASSLDFASDNQLVAYGRRMARKQAERFTKLASEFDLLVG